MSGAFDPADRTDPLRATLRLRIISSAVMIPAAVVFVVAGSWWLVALAVFLASLMSYEWTRLACKSHWPMTLGPLLIALVAALGVAHENWGAAVLVLVLGLGIAAGAARFARLGARQLVAALGLLYIGAAGVALIGLRETAGGQWLVLWLFTLTWVFDTAAYVTGQRYGRRPIAPGVSPDKTWEGLQGGVLAAAIVGLTFAPVLPGIGPLGAALSSAGLAVAAQIGDLLESAVKRRFGVKDMSRLVPGHGGVMDRLDSLMLVLIVAGAVAAARGG